MELYDVMRTTFAAREFTDDPVPDAVLHRILDNARFAASGGNRQGWRVLVVREAATREMLAALIEPTMKRYLAQTAAGEAPFNTIDESRVSEEQIAAVKPSRRYIENVVNAPVILLVFVDLGVVASFDSGLDRVGVISGASVYTLVQNILLAARNEGYGGTLTTFAAPEEAALRGHLGVPDRMAFAAMIPLGRPVRQLTRLKRKPVEDIACLERWDGPGLQS